MVKRGKRTKRMVVVGVAAGAVLFAGAFPGTGHASPARSTAPTLGTAATFAVLAGSTVTNTGKTLVNGDLGVSPGSAITGFPPGLVIGGSKHAGDAVAAQAQNDAATAYNNLVAQPCNSNLTAQDLGGKTLTAGVYCFSTSAQLTGALTLNGQGNPGSVFIFQIGSTLTTANASSVLLINSAQPCNVFWQVGSSATLGTNTTFAGNILALTSITLNTGAMMSGRALALNGAVTMDTNRVFASPCIVPPTPTATVARSTATATTVPIPTATIVPATPTAIAATATAVAAATNTAIAAPTSTAIAAPTSTAIAAATNTAIAAPTSTAVAAATSTAIAAATSTAVIGATSTAIAAATSTAVIGATSTPTTGATATPTARPSKSPTPTAIATPTRVVSHHPVPPAHPMPTVVPRTGAGGTSVFSASRLVAPRGAAPSKGVQTGGSSPQASGVATLPRTGGGAAGGTPASPLAPLAFLGAMALAVGRLIMRVTKR